MMQQPFEIIDHTADIGIIVYAPDMGSLFARAALGMFSLIMYNNKFKGKIKREVEITANSIDELLVSWLNELIFIFEVEHIILYQFQIIEISDVKIRAFCFGEKINRRHKIAREIKAATYHMLNISEYNNGLKAQVIFDL